MTEQLARLLTLPDTPHYNIKAVVQQTQVNISTLRAWEQRYGVPNPTRSDHGHRLYSQRDIAIITWLRECTEAGLAVSQAVAMLRDINATDWGSRLDAAAHPPFPTGAPPKAGLPELRARLSAALLHVQMREAHLIVNAAMTQFSTEELVLDLFQPTLVETGRRWSRGEISVAQEHVISNFIRHRLIALTQVHAPFSHGPRLICICAPGELHELGLLMFSLLMEQRGWELTYIGQSVEIHGLSAFLTTLAPALVCLSAVMVEHSAGLLEVAQLIDELRPHRVRLAYAGRAFDRHPELRLRMPGAYLGGDLQAAIASTQAIGAELLASAQQPHAVQR